MIKHKKNQLLFYYVLKLWVQISMQSLPFFVVKEQEKSKIKWLLVRPMAINIRALFHFDFRSSNNKNNFWFYDRLFKTFGVSYNTFIGLFPWSRRSFGYKDRGASSSVLRSYLIYSTILKNPFAQFYYQKLWILLCYTFI